MERDGVLQLLRELGLTGAGDCFGHWHSEDRVATQSLRHGLEGVAKVKEIDSNYAITPHDDFLNVSQAATLTLPLARNGQTYTITQTGVGNVQVNATAPNTICGSSSLIMTLQWMSLTLKAVPSGWIIV